MRNGSLFSVFLLLGIPPAMIWGVLYVFSQKAPWWLTIIMFLVCILADGCYIFARMLGQSEEIRRQLRIVENERDSAIQAADTDPLTGLFNRRGMSLLARKILKAQMRFVHDDAGRNDLRVTVAVIDLDGFKAVNDTLGHPAGDIVIRLASELLRRYFGRGTDIVCRLGGDELLVLTIGIDDVESTNSRLEEFRRTFKQEADRFLTDQLHVTASCGVKAVSIPKEGEIDLDSLIEQADALLYQAKRGGKDRVVIDD